MTRRMWIVFITASWIGMASLNYAMLLADIQKSFPSVAEKSCRHDMGATALVGALFGITGPLGLAITFSLTGFAEHGLQWKCYEAPP